MQTNKSVHGSTKQPHKKVLILGAGLSGIVAGKTLLDNGIDDFLVLEGQDYIGGRIKLRSFAGYNIEEGANWIQFADDEDTKPMWKVKEEKQLTGVWADYFDLIIRDESGEDVTSPGDIQKWLELKQLNDSPIRTTLPDNISIRDGLKTFGWDPATPSQWALDYLFTNYELGCSADKVSFKGYFFVPEKEFFVTDQRGMISLFEELITSVECRVRINKEVARVAYSTTGVKVTTSDGEVYTSDYALCTFSTGVLASDMVTFTPPLPQWKQEAILKSPMTVYTKIFLKFTQKFWDDKQYILISGKKHGFYPVLQNLVSPGKFPEGSGLLLITVTEDEGRRIENQSLEETKAEIVEMLRGVYGPSVPEPTDIFYPRWSTNPFIRGAFSEPLIGCSPHHAEHISQNVHNLYFAGEATSEWHGYMQGAYLSGQEKARILAKLIKM